MPYLNWKEAQVQAELRETHPRRPTLALLIPLASWGDWISALEACFSGPAESELRVDLPREWISFWKIREGESRLLLAHPEKDQWVSTAALEKTHADRLLAKLKSFASGDSVSVSSVAPVSSVSNVEILIQVV